MGLMKLFDRICNKFAIETIAASGQRRYILGATLNSKRDVRTEFIANLRMIRELAQLRNEDDVVAKCSGQIVSELTAIKADLEAELAGKNTLTEEGEA
tara:strand:- start:150 stop:443 length:294 start_codon:yes stop_codon:yes gene_type:complete